VSADLHVVWTGFLGSFVAGMATGLGALLIFAIRRFTVRTEVVMLASAAGIMLAATFFSLLLPALELAEQMASSKVAAAGEVIGGVLSGALGLMLLHRFMPHEHFFTGREGPSRDIARIWLFVIAIALHNFPEGMAVGVGFAGGDYTHGLSLATGIGIQNMPEGLAVAAALLAAGYAKSRSFFVAFLTGLIEPVGGLLGSSAVWLAQSVMPWVLGMTAGAMLFIISDEMIPETHRKGFQNLATLALMGGFTLMMFLDVVLG
jgi:ZIP family zinc transporter